jgi:hypothetical protein
MAPTSGDDAMHRRPMGSPNVAYDERPVDSTAAVRVRDAQRYDVTVPTSMFGDILSDLSSELSGSPELVNVARRGAWRRRSTAPRPISRGRAWPIRSRSFSRRRCCWIGWRAARGGEFRVDGDGDRTRSGRDSGAVGDADARPRRQARDPGVHRGAAEYAGGAACRGGGRGMPSCLSRIWRARRSVPGWS